MSVAFLMLPRGRAKGIDMTSSLSSVFFDDYYDTKWDISDPITWAFIDDGSMYTAAWTQVNRYSKQPEANSLDIVRDSFESWDSVIPDIQVFREVNDATSAKLIVAFPANWSQFTTEKSTPNAWGFWESTWTDGIRNKASIELDNSLTDSELQIIALHEIGNVLGLGDYNGPLDSVQSDPVQVGLNEPQMVDVTWLNSLYADDIEEILISTNSASTTSQHTVTLIADVLGSVMLLKDLNEVITEISHNIEYNGTIFEYSEIDGIITTVIRDGEFTDEFAREIEDAHPSSAGITYNTAVTLIGQANMESTLLAVAGADGNYVG